MSVQAILIAAVVVGGVGLFIGFFLSKILYSLVTLFNATPSTAQFVVIKGR